MPRILVADALPKEGLAVLEKIPGIELDLRHGLKGAELKEAICQADGLIVRSGTTVTPELLTPPSRLKVIVRAGVGVDNIDVPAATRVGAVVMNTPDGNTISTAEQTWALMLAMVRKTSEADASLRGGKWERSKLLGTQLAGKTLGIIGLGRIGMKVAERAKAFEMKVLGYDPVLAPAKAHERGIDPAANLSDLLARSDILTMHVPLTDATKDLISAYELAQMKPGSFLINCARGGIVNEQALLEAIQRKHLAGAALDVYTSEPMPDTDVFRALRQEKNVILTPHLGASTSEAQLNVAIEAAELLSEYFLHGRVRNAVNMPSLELDADTRLHLDIARRLGLLQAQLAKGASIQRATIEFRGDATKLNTKLLTTGFAMGLLEALLPDAVNIVNAQLLAEERGIKIDSSLNSEPGDFRTLLSSSVTSDTGTIDAAGTTRGSQYVRLVKLGPYRLDAYLDGTSLIYWHQDRPGVIGLVGTILGNYHVNIAQMMVGRSDPGGPAIGVLCVDTIPPPEAIDEIRRDDRIKDVAIVKLPKPGETPW